ncbi:MAG TPA: PQQ-dependent sugar dehydrogenase [Acidimicrobiales bacterium]|nr:PQQ-dependent sugar dehydrogenase [Acidimicrobiales bacterium]
MASLVTAASRGDAASAVKAKKVLTLSQPVAFAIRSGDAAKVVYIAQQNGVVKRFTLGGTTTDAVDLTDRVKFSGEEGLLGIAFNAAGTKLYTYWTNSNGDNGVYEYPFANGVADKTHQRTLFTIAHPTYTNHNGGDIAFGPDNLLYVGTGDGGGSGDPGGNAQNPASLLGKLLRIDASNTSATPQIVDSGLRNPWRWSFDKAAPHDLWIGDVGQDNYEEIDHVTAATTGANFGWNQREGLHAYNGGAKPANNVDPVYEYSHADGSCAITGGYVYRGTRIAGLAGSYVFADYCIGNLLAFSGTTASPLNVHVAHPSSFGQDKNGELWVLSTDGGVYRLLRKAA